MAPITRAVGSRVGPTTAWAAAASSAPAATTRMRRARAIAQGAAIAAMPIPPATAADSRPKPPIPAMIAPSVLVSVPAPLPEPEPSASRRSRIASIVVTPKAARPRVTPARDTQTRDEERAARKPSANPPAKVWNVVRARGSPGRWVTSSSSGPRCRRGSARTAHTPTSAVTTDGTSVHETAASPAPSTASTAKAATAPIAVTTEPTVTSTEFVAARIRSGTTLGIAAVMPVLMRRPRPIATSDNPNSAARPGPLWTAPAAMRAMVATIASVLIRAATATTTRRSQRSSAAAANGPTIEYGRSITAKPPAIAAGVVAASGLNRTIPPSAAWWIPSLSRAARRAVDSRPRPSDSRSAADRRSRAEPAGGEVTPPRYPGSVNGNGRETCSWVGDVWVVDVWVGVSRGIMGIWTRDPTT